MSGLATLVPADFLPRFLAGMALNFEIAGLALLGGLLLGLPFAWARSLEGIVGKLSGGVVTLLRAAPTFVVMFFLLNAIPQTISVFGYRQRLSGVAIVALSLLPYSVAYVAKSGEEAWRYWRRGSPLAAWLFFPNITRAFFVLVMSSSAGAAIGVTEGITVILRQAQHLPDLAHRLWLYGFGIACFGITLQAGFAAIALLHHALTRSTQRRMIQRLMATSPAGDL